MPTGKDQTESHPKLIAALAILTVGAGLATAGGARLYAEHNDNLSLALVALGGFVLGAGAFWTVRLVDALPDCEHDCARYGRHMIGLTFLLVLLGLCNGVGTSTLALEGGLSFSAQALVLASDPARIELADKQREIDRKDLAAKDRAISDAKRLVLRAEKDVARLCPAETPPAAESGECSAARNAAFSAQDEVIGRNYDYDEAYAKAENSKQICERTRSESRAALFFLLSTSTMMSLFGATFYVVNRVRSKRPLLANDTDAPQLTEGGEPGSSTTAEPAPTTGQARDAKRDVPQTHTEPFDAYAFWSGAFFRVGEAVLFTFAFFWLIWTSGDRTHVVWMPVLGLFVGMFVRTGEAVVFRLGERLLNATQALLPAVDAPPPAQAKRVDAAATAAPNPSVE
jgi:hypothetical protein